MEEILFDSEKINRFFKGDYSEKDKLYIEKAFCDKNIEKELNHHLLRQFYELLPEDDFAKKNLDHILYKLHYDINTRLPVEKHGVFNNILKWTLRIAGVIMLPIVVYIGIHTYSETKNKNEAWVEIKAPAWTRAQFSLPDGTTGWLNSNSSIKYYGNFYSDREVELIGEAFFDVVKDSKRPFMVNTNEVVIKVLGTKFNISSFENEENVEVVLEEGKLIFCDHEMMVGYTMEPNDLIVYNKKQKHISTEVVDPIKYLSWKEGKLIFRNDPVDVIARRLERWYNVDVEVDGVFDGDLRLRATFIDEGLEEVLGLLKHSLPIDYTITKGNLSHDEIYSKTNVKITNKTN